MSAVLIVRNITVPRGPVSLRDLNFRRNRAAVTALYCNGSGISRWDALFNHRVGDGEQAVTPTRITNSRRLIPMGR
jgi:hypothetical protein